MPVLNHHIVSAQDKEATARYFSEFLGLDAPFKLGEFAVLRVVGDTTLDFIDTEGEFDRQHYAFLVTEAEFDEIFGRINTWDDGRGVYFDDPNGHRLEILTRPYGSGGTEAQHPHPLIAPTIGASKGPTNIH